MSNFTYIPFTSIDFAGNPSLSSYALDATPLTFVPDLSNIENARVLWSFGDGTTSTAITARKTYHEAGTYNVNLVVYDCFSKAQISTTSQTYEIKNFIDETFTIELSSNEWKNGQINGPISIKSYTPINTKPTNIFYTVNDSNSINYELIKNDKFAHLSPTYQFYDKIYNFAIRSQQYSPINLISFEEYDTIYAKISSNEVVICDKQDIDAFTVGLSSEKVVYFKDDSISDKITIDFFLDQKNSNINNLNVTLSASIIENDDVNRLSITSNGIDGEFYSISSFDIDSIKFYDAWIPFVIKIKDNLNHSVKNFQISGFTVDLL
jgi:PKD repeat protein